MLTAILLASALANVWAFLAVHFWPAVAAAVIVLPSVITAATDHPDVVPTNILHVLQYLLQALSWLKHSNEVGLFKMPLSWSTAPQFARKVVSSFGPSSGGFVRNSVLATLALCSIAAAFAVGCASVFGSTIASDELACLGKVASDVEQRAAAVLLAGGANFDTQVAGLVADLGKDGALCAIEAAVNDFEAQQAVVPDAGSPGMNALVAIGPKPDYAGAIARGKATAAKLRGR